MTSLFEQELSLRPLREMQSSLLPKIKTAIREGHKRIIVQAPTGYGKTLVAAHIIAAALRKGNRPLFTCPAITLVEQTLRSFEAEGIRDIGIMQADHHRTDSSASLQIASVQTLMRRTMTACDFAIIDEVHEEFDGLYAMLDSDAWKNRIAIGLSATPWKKGMGLHWSKLIIAATINELISSGFAVPAKIYGPAQDVDRESVPIVNGEFEEEGSSKLMSDATVVGDVIEEWKEKSTREKTFMFCVNRNHARAQRDAFEDCGFKFGYIDANTPVGQRDTDAGTRLNIFAQMRNGIIAGVASVGCLIRGVDEDVRCIADLKLRKSEIAHVQLWGRGVRTAPGKRFLIGLDHAGNNVDLGLFTDIYHDTLDTRKPSDRGEAYKGDNKPAKPRKCPKCFQVVPPTKRACPNCGERVEHQHNVRMIDGRLVEIGSNYKANEKERQMWYSGFLWLAKKRNLSNGWAAHRFREKFGVWPDGLRVQARKPSEAIIDADKKQYAAYRERAKTQAVAEEYHGEF
jgi:DNA repair protein RadD